MAIIRHVSLDGFEIQFESEELDLSLPAVSNAVFTTRSSDGRHEQEFTSGPREWASAVAEQLFGVSLSEQYDIRRGKLLIGVGRQPLTDDETPVPVVVGAWVSESWSVRTHQYFGSTVGMLATFDSFDFSLTDAGPIMRVRDPSTAESREEADVVKEIRGLGLVASRRITPRVARTLPNWPGMSVPGGELFVDAPGTPAMSWLLISNTARAMIYPDAYDSEIVPEGLFDIRIDWAPVSPGNEPQVLEASPG